MSTFHDAIRVAKARLPLPSLLARLDLATHAKASSCCPFHEDRSPSFSVWHGTHGWRWKCHAGCGEGDEIDFLERHWQLSRADAIRRYCAMAGQSSEPATPAAPPRTNPERSTSPQLPPDATPSTEADWRALAALRHLSPFAPAKAAELGTLFFGTVCGFRCWIITDERRLCAEARRMDGAPFPPVGSLAARKAHTLKGSVKSWPVGLAVRGYTVADFRAVLAVEGGPDYLAALDFTLADKADCLPIAFLGAGTASEIHADALPLLRGLRVRFYPHHEARGAGNKAVSKWAQQFAAIGANLDAFSFEGLRKDDGSPVKDLNDCTRIHTEDAGELEGLLP